MRDRYGEYYLLTGLEEKTHCFWCGTAVKGGRRYCCEEHHELYLENFRWPEASSACLKRYGGKCGDCGKPTKWASDMRVHHIIPLDGGYRLWNILNQPDNLIALCPACHGKRHSSLPKTKVEQAVDRGQLVFEGILEKTSQKT